MNKTLLTLLLLGSMAWAQAEGRDGPRAEVFKALQVGQSISVTPKAGGYELSLFNDGKTGSHKVVEIGAQSLTLDDLSGVSRVWIPVTAVSSVVWTRVQLPTGGYSGRP